MAEKEKALADALYLRHISYETFSEILREHRKEIDIRRLIDYLKRMGVKRIIKRGEADDNKK